MSRFLALMLTALLVLTSGCVTQDVATQADFNDLPGANDKEVIHVNTNSYALHFLGSPLWGNATLANTVRRNTAEHAAAGVKRVRIVQSDVSSYWWIFPPFSFILTPVFTNVASDGDTQ